MELAHGFLVLTELHHWLEYQSVRQSVSQKVLQHLIRKLFFSTWVPSFKPSSVLSSSDVRSTFNYMNFHFHLFTIHKIPVI